MDEKMLDKEELKNNPKLAICYGLLDELSATFIFFFFISFVIYIPPPFVNIIIDNFGSSIFVFVAILLLIMPVLLLIAIELILGYRKNFYKDADNEKGKKKISTLAFYVVPIIIIFYLPTTTYEFFWWIFTIFGLYIGFGKERAPLIRYGIEMSRLERRQAQASMENVRKVSPSFFILNISLMVVILAACLNIYPVPFLLFFYFKYLIQRIFFNDFSPQKFYKNWDKSEGILLNIFWVIAIITCIFFIISMVSAIDTSFFFWFFSLIWNLMMNISSFFSLFV